MSFGYAGDNCGNMGWVVLGAEETKKMKKQPTAVQIEVKVVFLFCTNEKMLLICGSGEEEFFPLTMTAYISILRPIRTFSVCVTITRMSPN